jgi:hypothetical protein
MATVTIYSNPSEEFKHGTTLKISRQSVLYYSTISTVLPVSDSEGHGCSIFSYRAYI